MSKDIPDTIILSKRDVKKLIKIVIESEGEEDPKSKKDIKLLTPEEAEKVMFERINRKKE